MVIYALLNRGIKYDTRTRTGWFFKEAKAELVRQLDHPASVGEQLLIDQAVMWRFQINELQEQLMKAAARSVVKTR